MKPPKEYAKELVEKYLPLVRNSDLYDTYFNKAKQCALIDVQNTIDANPCCEDSDRGGNLMYVNNSYYFEQVKTEIINLK